MTPLHKTTDLDHAKLPKLLSRNAVSLTVSLLLAHAALADARLSTPDNAKLTQLTSSSPSTSSSTASTANSSAVSIDIPAQPLSTALHTVADRLNTNILFDPEQVKNIQAPAVRGSVTIEQALTALLAGTKLKYEFMDERTISLMPATGKTTSNLTQLTSSSSIRLAQSQSSETQSNSSQAAQQPQSAEGTTEGPKNPSEAPTGAKDSLQEVVVTAQKREQALIDVPISITALSGEDLERRGTTDILSVSHSVPGLVVVDRGPGEQQYTVRGIGNQNGRASLVGVYLDEMAITNDPLRQIDLPLIDLARVEVLRGPQGTLYGEGSAGGTIRFITRDPGLTSFSGHLEGGALFTQGGDPGEDVTAIVDAPVVSNTFGLRLATHYTHAGGWIDQPAASREHINDQEVGDARLKALWKAGDAFELRGMVAVHRGSFGWGNNADEHYDLAYAVDRQATPPRRHDDYELYNLTVNYDFENARLLSSTSFLDSEKFLPFSQIGSPGIEFSGANTVDSRIFTQELRLNSSRTGPLNWTVGGFYQDSKIENPLVFDLLIVGSGVIPGIASRLTTESRSWAAFGEVSYKFGTRVEAGAGVRYFRDDANDGGAQSATFDATSPRGFVTVALTQNAKAYASIGKGFRSGGFNSQGQPPYSPDRVIAYELGLKGAFTEPRLDFDIALFRMDYDDLLAFRNLSPTNPVNILFNVGKARVKGIDASLNWRPIEQLRLGVNGNYTDHEITELNPVPSAYIVGDRLDYVSDYNYALYADGSFNWSSDLPGFVRLDYSRIGKITVTNRLFGIFNSSDPIALLNLRVGARRNNWLFEVFGTNLTNENGSQIPFAPVDTSRPRPRTIGIRVGVDFK